MFMSFYLYTFIVNNKIHKNDSQYKRQYKEVKKRNHLVIDSVTGEIIMKDSKSLMTSKTSEIKAVENREEVNQKNLDYLDLLYDGGVYQVGQHYVCIKNDFKNQGITRDKVFVNEGLVGVDLYDKNLSLIEQYNTSDDIISYEWPSEGREHDWLIIQLSRRLTVDDNYLIIIDIDYNDFNNGGMVIHNAQSVNMLLDAGYEQYQTEHTSDFWQNALGISLIDTIFLGYLNKIDLNCVQSGSKQDIIINIDTYKILGIFKGGYLDCIGENSVTDADGNCIYFGWTNKGVQAIEHKYDGSEISVKTFDTVENLLNHYKPLVNLQKNSQMIQEEGLTYEQLGYTNDEKYFKFRGQLQKDNKLRKVGEFIEIEDWDLYVENNVLNLLNIDGKKLDIETTSKEQEEIVKVFGQEQTAQSQCPIYIRQTEKDNLIIVQNNTIIVGRLEGENIDGTCFMIWHKLVIEYAFRNKIEVSENTIYTWKFLEDSIEYDYTIGGHSEYWKDNIEPVYKVYLCIDEYDSIQKQTSCVLMYNMHTGETITDKNKIRQVYKIHNREVYRYSNKWGKDWKCLWERCCIAWDTRCNWHNKFAKRYKLYGTCR